MRRNILAVTALLIAAATMPAAGQDDDKALYVSLLPHFLVNLADPGARRFMQIKAQVLVADKDTEIALKTHMPAVRHEMLMMLSDLKTTDVETIEQKEKLANDSLNIVLGTLREHGAADRVKGFFITNLVIK